ncbi:putative H /K ATPase alpha subunit [Rhizodiscina lignyota]|uniref:H /K ATPase alpha subunit n=1 Tax=Rhizodiscina lignyota TaxID=1504668 RepID=A0A9P4M309_9PEZI|nr:putative H /K ATPase alpha subunit [Rhizodiscina lignyota]
MAEKGSADVKGSDVELEITRQQTGRVRYADDVENHPRRERARSRSHSVDSISIRSLSRGRYQVDPNVALPIEYRTMSFNIEETKQRYPKYKAQCATACLMVTGYLDLDWHKIPVDEIYQRLSTSPTQGLSREQVDQRLKEYGANTITPPPSRWVVKTLMYFFGGFGSVLLVASILVFVAWKPLGQPPAVANLALAIVLAIVFFLQAAFNFWQDWSSSRVMASIKNMLPDECIVLRDASQQSLSGVDIVPGDILRIKMGVKLPADIRFIQVSPDAKFDRSVLTGESIPVRATVDSTENNYLETTCIGMAGTHCTSGDSFGVVVATGDKTVFGNLAKLTSAPKTGLTNLEKEIYYFVAIIVGIMLTMIIVVIIVWASWLRHSHPSWISVPLLIVDCVSVAVAFIPEGLPIAVTSSLTIVANIMRRNQILCKSLKTVETLGSVSVICSDKTGTLTSNKMTVTECLVDKMAVPTAEAILESGGFAKSDTANEALRKLAFVGGLCNAGEFDPTDSKKPLVERKIMGDATDQAVLRFSQGLLDVSKLREQWRVMHKVPFNSKNKFMIHVLKEADMTVEKPLDTMLLTMKGAPDILLPRCSQYVDSSGATMPLTDEHRKFVEKTRDDWSRNARRIILLAEKPIQEDPRKPISSAGFEDSVLQEANFGLRLIGLVGIVDPPRPEIPEVIKTLRGAGIKVFMVTGDAKLTAQAIAAECGIISQTSDYVASFSAITRPSSPQLSTDLAYPEHTKPITNSLSTRAIVLTGPDMQEMDDSMWDSLCRYDEIVFARTTPEQKLKIVRELQAREEVVGMTGDGVNDAPSLKAADIGIAMGTGSDIAIEAADMVLLDSFSAIVEAVKYGRVVFDNLKKTICYLLPAGSFSEFWPVMTNVFFGLPQVLSSFLMIIICCFTDCAAAIAIAYEKPEADMLLQPPRNPRKDHLVNWQLILNAYGFIGVLETVSSFAVGYWYLQRNGVPFSTQWFGFGQAPAGMSSDRYTELLNTASSIYFVNLVVMQWFTLHGIRTRRLSILQHPPLFRKETMNIFLYPAIIFSMLIAIFFLYVPKFQEKLATAVVPVAHWFLPMVFGLAILLLDEARKAWARKYPRGLVAKCAW